MFTDKMEAGFRQRHVNPNNHDEIKSSALVYYTVGVLAAGGALGTIGNVLVTYFFHSRRRTYPGRHFILLLAVLDLITCLVVVPMIIYIELVQFPIQIFLCKLYQLLVNAQFLCVALVLMVAALDRLFYLGHSKKYSQEVVRSEGHLFRHDNSRCRISVYCVSKLLQPVVLRPDI